MCREVEKMALAERNKGRIEANAKAVCNIMNKMSLSLEEAMQFLELPEAEKDAVRKQSEQ